MIAAVDWTNVLDTLITTLPAIVAALVAIRVHHLVRTPSGKTIGQVAEYAHDTVIANNLLLSKSNGPTKHADPGELQSEAETPPRVPVVQTAPQEG